MKFIPSLIFPGIEFFIVWTHSYQTPYDTDKVRRDQAYPKGKYTDNNFNNNHNDTPYDRRIKQTQWTE